MGYRKRLRASGKPTPTRAVIDRFNTHKRETYPEIQRKPTKERAIPRYVFGDPSLGEL